MFDFILPPDVIKPITMLNDRGGRVSDYLKAAQNYTNQVREVRIIGLCWSACSLALSVPNVCVGPMATVMFHDAYDLKSGKTDPAATKELLNKMPEKFKKQWAGWFKKNFTQRRCLTQKNL